jgi:hypothetical protein
MSSWFVRPETDTLPLSDGHWIKVKRRLNTGEFRAHLKRSVRLGEDGVRRVEALDHGLSVVMAYLLDWSLEAAIRDVSSSDLASVLDSLDPERFAEIKAAIETHEDAMTAERNQKKTTTAGATKSDPISPSPSEPDSLSTRSGTLM